MKFKNNYKILFPFILLASLALAPFILTILIPDLCYGCTFVGKIHQYMNENYSFAYICWVSYIFVFIYLIFQATYYKNTYLKVILIILYLFLIYLPVFPISTIINLFLFLFYNNPPFIHNYHDVFPQSIEIEKKSNTIINEYNEYMKADNKIDCIKNSNPGFGLENTSNEKNCWKAIYLKKVGKIQENMLDFFPETLKLLNDDQIHNAFFSILEPGVEIPPHKGYYKGYLRYHLGVEIPNNESNKTDDKAYIICGGEKYIWKKNQGILFDDMYTHYVKNPSNKTRVVLYLDVKRKNNNKIVDFVNNIGILYLENSILLKMFLTNQHKQIKIQ